MPDAIKEEQATELDKPEIEEREREKCKSKVNSLIGFFPWVKKESTKNLHIRVRDPKKKEVITGVGVYKNNETCRAQFRRSLTFFLYYLKIENFVYSSTFESAKAKFQFGSKDYLGIELIEIELMYAEDIKSANKMIKEIEKNGEVIPNTDIIWALSFNLNIVAELGKICTDDNLMPVILVPGVFVDGAPVVIACVGRDVVMTTLRKENEKTPILFPRYCK